MLFERGGVVYCMIGRRGCGRNCDTSAIRERCGGKKIRSRSMKSIENEFIEISSLNDACGISFVDLDFFVSISLPRNAD